MAGGAARGEESATWRKAESAGTRFWQNRAPSASVYVYTTHLCSSRDLAYKQIFCNSFSKECRIGFTDFEAISDKKIS